MNADYRLKRTAAFWLFATVLAVISIGLGTVLPTTTVAIQNAVEVHELGTATGTMNFFRQLGSAVTVAIFGALLNASGISEAALHTAGSVAAVSFTDTATSTQTPISAQWNSASARCARKRGCRARAAASCTSASSSSNEQTQ